MVSTGRDFGLVADLTNLVNSDGVQHEVAAATHQIGNAAGESWTLDVGNVNAASFFNASALSNWTGSLATYTVTVTDQTNPGNADGALAGTLRNTITSAEAGSGSATVSFSGLTATNTITINSPINLTQDTNNALTVNATQLAAIALEY